MADWGKLLEQLQGQTKTKLQALDTLQVRGRCCMFRSKSNLGTAQYKHLLSLAAQSHVDAASLGRDNISSLLDYTPQLLGDNNFKASFCVSCCRRGCMLVSQTQPAVGLPRL